MMIILMSFIATKYIHRISATYLLISVVETVWFIIIEVEVCAPLTIIYYKVIIHNIITFV